MHPLFGKLAFNADDNCWEAAPPLTQLAALGVHQEKPVDERALKRTLALAQDALDKMKKRMLERLGPDGREFYDALQAAAESDDDDDDDEDGDVRNRYEAQRRLEERRRRAGLFPIHIPTADDRAPPSPEQQAALRHLHEQQAAIHDALIRTLLQSHQAYSGDSRRLKAGQLKDQARVESATIRREHHQGISYVVFHVDCDWEIEHGMVVVYHPVKGAHWTTLDGLDDLIESDECFEEWIEIPGNQELVEAILAGDDARIEELRARGDDINDCGPDAWPPLCSAVEQLDVDLVKRLLDLGANPGLIDSEGQTAIQRARRLRKQFNPPPQDRLMNAAFKIMKRLNAAAYEESRAKIDAILALLERPTGS